MPNPSSTVAFAKYLIANGNRRRGGGVALHLGGGSVAREGLNGGRQGDAGGAERQAGGRARGGADEEALVVVGDVGLGQGVEVGENLGPGCRAAEFGDALLELGLEDEGEETGEHVAADGRVELVEDRPGGEQVLGRAEGRLHGPELLVAQHGGEWVEVGVGAQYEDAVEPGVLPRLAGIDGEVAVAFGLEKAAETGVADQRLVAPGQLTSEVGQNGSACGGVPFGLLMVATEDVASPAHGHRLGLVVDLVAALGDGQRHARRGVGEHDITDHLVGALAGAEQRSQVALLEQTGRPSPSMRTARIIWQRSGRWSLLWPRRPSVCPPAPSK